MKIVEQELLDNPNRSAIILKQISQCSRYMNGDELEICALSFLEALIEDYHLDGTARDDLLMSVIAILDPSITRIAVSRR